MPRRDDEDPVLDEAFIAEAAHREPSAAERAASRQRQAGSVQVRPRPPLRHRRDLPGMVALLLAAVMLFAAVRLHALPGLTGGGGAGSPGGESALVGAASQAPPRAAVHELRRVLPAPAVPPSAPTARYAFLQQQDGRPVGWDPCAPVHLAVRPDGEPAGGRALLRQALDRLSTATGLQLVLDSDTDERPSDARSAYQPQRYGTGWAPVLVAWSDPAESPRLADSVEGYAGPVAWSASNAPRKRFVSGSVVLDAPQLSKDLAEPGGGAQVRAVLLHELGHLVGLDHVQDVAQLMNPEQEATSPTDYAPGDLRGLALLGSAPCV